MDSLVNILNNPMAVVAAQLGIGWLVKNKTGVVNKAIPLINYVVALVLQIPGVTTGTQPAYASAGLDQALCNPLVGALLCTLVATGTHSTVKNLGQLLRMGQVS